MMEKKEVPGKITSSQFPNALAHGGLQRVTFSLGNVRIGNGQESTIIRVESRFEQDPYGSGRCFLVVNMAQGWFELQVSGLDESGLDILIDEIKCITCCVTP